MNTCVRRSRLVFVILLLISSSSVVLAGGFSFVHVSDCHITGSGRNQENLTAVINEINSMVPKPAFVVVTGDLTETGLPADLAKYKEIISAYQMPVYNVFGNHETKWAYWGKTGLKRFFNQEPFYSFNYNNVHFVAMDSSTWMQHHGLLDRAQLTWLRKDLEQAGPDTPSVLFYHHCPGFIPNEPELLRTIAPFNVRLILVGHGHTIKTWKKNGLFFQEGKGSMNDQGGFRLLEVSESEIKSYTKLTGKSPVPDGVISLKPKLNPVKLVTPMPEARIDGSVRIRAIVEPGADRKVEYAIDSNYQPVTPDANGVCDVTAPFEGTPGWHILTVRATDPDGMEWTDTALVRINAGSREAWHLQVSGAVQRAIRAYGDRLYFGTLGGDVYCLNAKTGWQIWKTSLGSDVLGQVAVDERFVYLGVADGRILALDAQTGRKEWEFATGGPVQGCPIVDNGVVYVGSGEPAYYALEAATGKLRWKTPMDRMTQVLPLNMNGALYFGAWDRYFYALNKQDGSIRWKAPIGISFFYSTANSDPVTDGKRIAANVTPYKPEDPDIYCLDAETGNILWKQHNAGKSDCGFNSPYVIGDRLYCLSGNGEVYCYSMADGKEIWKSSAGISILSGKPAAADGKLYIPGLRGNLACMDAETGKLLWTYSTGNGYLFCAPTVSGNLVIMPSTDGSITALYR